MLVLAFLCPALLIANPAGTIAVTIDDLPCVGPRTRSVKENIERLVRHLAKAQVVPTGCVCGDRDNFQAMQAWIQAGFPLGNHTYSHVGLSQMSPQAYITDIERNEKVYRENCLVELRGGFFRFPFLDHGNSEEKVQALESFFKRAPYRIAHVSLDTIDYRFALEYAKPKQQKMIHTMYINHVEECANHFASMSLLLFQRRIPLILLIHANELNADCLGDVLTRLSQKGWLFVSLEAAMEDSVYQAYVHRPPLVRCPGDRNFLNQISLSRGITALDISGDKYFQEYWLPLIRKQ